jgi:hypothetical protein
MGVELVDNALFDVQYILKQPYIVIFLWPDIRMYGVCRHTNMQGGTVMKYRTGKVTLSIMILMAAAFAVTGTASARSLRFTAHLSGNAQVPDKINSKAAGIAVFSLSKDGKELFYKLRVRDIDNVTMAHIHLAPADKNGPPVVWLYPGTGMAPMEKAGRFSGILAKGKITEKDLIGPLEGKPISALIDAIKSGDTYVNVHTTKYPDGEIRGQLR